MTELRNDLEFDYETALRACAKGDEKALHKLYQVEAKRLLGVVMRIVRQKQIAEDLVHDAFLSIWTQASSFDGDRGAARGWIYSIARHKALNFVRNNTRQVSMDEEHVEAMEAEAAQEVFEEAYILSHDLGKLEHCLQHLDSAKRNSIIFAYVDGCSHGEIAARLSTPLGTVKAWIRRGLASLRECLA